MGLEKIRTSMKIRNLTSEGLAEICGVPKSTIDKIMSGNTDNPKFKTIQAIANALCLTVDELTDMIGFQATKKAPTKISEGKYDDIIEMLDHLSPEQHGKVRGYIDCMIHENEAADVRTAKQISNSAS